MLDGKAKRRAAAGFALGILAGAAGACSKATTGRETPVCNLDGAEGMELKHVVGQGYWYSRFNLGSLNMMSGNGDMSLPLSMGQLGTAMTMMVSMVSDSASQAAIPTNVALVDRVFTTGNPRLSSPDNGDPMDFANGRWTPIPPSDQAVTSAGAFGWTLTKILEWNRQFHVDEHFGVPGSGDGIPGAQERFAGTALFAQGMMMSLEWMNTPSAFDSSDVPGTYAALMAFSDMAMILTQDPLPNSTSPNRYKMLAPQLASMVGMTVPDLMAAMDLGLTMMFETAPDGGNLHDAAIATQGLTWYLGVAPTSARPAVIARIRTNADLALAATPANAAERALQVRAAVEAWRVTGEDGYLDAASAAYLGLESAYDCDEGVFAEQNTYTSEDVAGIVGGLNAVLVHVADARPDDDVEFDRASAVLLGFWEATVDRSGFQISAPPPPATYEYEGDDLFHRHPAIPLPPDVGGGNGTAPVFARSVTYDPANRAWTVDPTYDVSGGMHLANEALWLHTDEVSGFPAIP